MWRCPQCGSTRLDQYRMPYGPMWCMDCAFRIKEKNITPNPFYVEEKQDAQEKPKQSGLGEQLAALSKKKKKRKK